MKHHLVIRLAILPIYYLFGILIRFKKRSKLRESELVLINSGRQVAKSFAIETAIAISLCVSGEPVLVIYDDGVLGNWDSVRWSSKRASTPFTGSFKGRLRWTFDLLFCGALRLVGRSFNVDYLGYSNLVKISVPAPDNIYSRHVESSYLRYFELDEMPFMPDSAVVQMLKKDEQVCKAVFAAVYERFSVGRLVTSHGVYTTWGPMRDSALKCNLPVVIWSMNANTKTQIKLTSEIRQLESDGTDFQNSFARFLKDSDIRDAESILRLRIAHMCPDNSVYFSKKGRNCHDILDQIKKKKEQGDWIIGLFPNIVWDGNIFERNNLFSSLVDWLSSSVVISLQYKVTLVIRFHPAEVTMHAGTICLEELFKSRCRRLNISLDGVILISSDSGINSHVLIKDFVDRLVLYDGTVGMESVYCDVPTFSVAHPRYERSGFVYTLASREEYKSIFADPLGWQDRYETDRHQLRANLLKFVRWHYKDSSYFLGEDLDPNEATFVLLFALQLLNEPASRAVRRLYRRIMQHD